MIVEVLVFSALLTFVFAGAAQCITLASRLIASTCESRDAVGEFSDAISSLLSGGASGAREGVFVKSSYAETGEAFGRYEARVEARLGERGGVTLHWHGRRLRRAAWPDE